MKTNMQLVEEIEAKVNAILNAPAAVRETEIRVGESYRNTVVTGYDVKVNAAVFVNKSVFGLDESLSDFVPAVERLESFVASKGIASLCRI